MSRMKGGTAALAEPLSAPRPVGVPQTAPVRPHHPARQTLTRRLLQRVGRTELRRRLWHMSPGLLSFGLWFFPHRDPISPTLQTILIGLILILAARIFLGFKSIQRRHEGDGTATWAVVGYAGSVLVTLLLFPGQAEIALGVLGVLAFGDGSATLGGLMFRGPALPWNRQKSWSGLISFIVVGTCMTALMYWGESHNLEARTAGVEWSLAVQCALIATVAAALAESIPSRINDNVRVGVVAAAALAIAHGMFVGWAG